MTISKQDTADGLKLCAIIPSRNHYRALGGIVDVLATQGIPVFVVDDGSDEPAARAIALLHDPAKGVELIRLPRNQGKGGAVGVAMKAAAAAGYSHAVQVDADGQHDLQSLDALVAAARAQPEALISGLPVYDRSIPRGRAIGRWLTHVWVWIETLSLQIKDSMCGFRVYPLAAALRVLNEEHVGRRMDFDTEIMVRMFWRGAPVVHVPVRVTYPDGNISNFRLFKDNWLITCMHTRLFFGMLWRLPALLRRRRPSAAPVSHWAGMAERGTYWGMQSLLAVYRLCGRRACLLAMKPVVFYFFLVGAEQRRASLDFLARIRALKGEPAPNWRDGFRHQFDFATKALDTFIGWARPKQIGPVEIVGGDAALAHITEGRGALLIVSHLGNAEIARAALAAHVGRPVHVLMHTVQARRYNAILRSILPGVGSNVIEVTEIGVDTAIALSERIDRGEWLVIAGDRIPVMSQSRVSEAMFLGEAAPFSQGPYILAALLNCPVLTLFCLREGKGHRAYFEGFADAVVLPRKARAEALAAYAALYAQRLEHHCLQQPLQWYNFYDFWAAPASRER
ncbi:glycosyltransferase family 2 protein [Bosea caraganae]|uniref:Glycosyltransferase family 2 protein n=1 Tax=Bosea caraganae TaxID=2763117 RepID=A0A370L854_9HYPH|nr:glycosyltransferase family 2 protein [Bosea caraganae]RDJ25229.1 glycosyltransferase family 2 protein [Bosea caraganae]RDJ26339.1 glycosyltransferase family 2 protein [Bosea caraganae]